jgi:hypothetical protein
LVLISSADLNPLATAGHQFGDGATVARTFEQVVGEMATASG